MNPNQRLKFLYNNEFLDKIIVSMLTDQRFLLKCMDLEMEQYIDSEPHEWYMKFITNFYKTYKVIPVMDSVKIKVELTKEPLLKQALSNTFMAILLAFDDENLDFIKDTVINFCRFQLLKGAIMKSIDLLRLEDYLQIYDLINKTRFKGVETNLGVLYVESFEERHTRESYKWVETPWPVINNALRGGLRQSKLGIVLAPPGVGKSWFLVNLASHALKQGKKVAYYTLLMTLDEIGCRVDIKLTGKPILYLDIPSNFAKVKSIIEPYRANLRIKLFLPNQTRLLLILNHLNQMKLFDGFLPDVVIIDYGDILKKLGDKNNMYTSYGDIFVGMKTLAKQYKFAVWSASQGNRGSINSLFILGDQVSHSMGKLEIADFLVSFSRKHLDKLSNTARFVIVKNRAGKDGMVYNGIVDMEIGGILMYDNFTQKSVEARVKMDGSENLTKIRVRLTLEALRQAKLKLKTGE